MAVAFDAQSSGNDSNPTLTFSHVCTGTDLLLIVLTAEWRGDSTSQVSGITYNSDPLTKLDQAFNTGLCSLWYLINPDTGTHDIVVSHAANDFAASGLSLTGVHQGAPFGTVAKDETSNLNVSSTVTVGTDDMAVDGVAIIATNGITVGADQTERATNFQGNAEIRVSTQPGSSGGAMTWTMTGDSRKGQIAVPVLAATATPAPTLRVIQSTQRW